MKKIVDISLSPISRITVLLAHLSLCIGLFLNPLVAQTSPSEIRSLERYIEEARKNWEVPGIAVAIVKDGEVILSQGYGVKQINTSEPIDDKTLFAIASNSKAFTATALAMLVDEGKVGWNDPVRKHLPYFELYDPYISSEIRVVDILCHRSGLGTYSGDLLWYGTEYSSEEIIHRVKFLPLAGSFRKDFGYSNLMFITAGLIIEKTSGITWNEFINSRILKPLAMQQTLTSPTQLTEQSNVATPHAYKKGEHKPYPWRPWDACAAAAGIISNVRDMSKWIKLQLMDGRWKDDRLVSQAGLNMLRTLHHSLPVSSGSKDLHPSTHFRGYGLGWALSDYQGRKIVNHGGAYDGMFSRVTLVPEENLGIVILTNSTTSLQTALTYRILDLFLAGNSQDWSDIYLERFRSSRSRWEKQISSKLMSRKTGTKPSLDLTDYTGRFGGPFYGDADVRVENGRIVIQLLPAKELIGDLKHLHLDTFRITWRNEFPWFDDGVVQFIQDSRGVVNQFVIDVPNEDFWFTELEFRRK